MSKDIEPEDLALQQEELEKIQKEKDEYWMMSALRLAQSARDQGEVPVGAILVKNDVQVAQAWNQPISLNDPTAHAEILCLRKAGEAQQNYRLNDCTLYVTLEPCAMCAGALLHARIKRLVYATKEPKAGCVHSHLELFNQAFINHSIEVTAGVCESESSRMLSDFFAERRSQKKIDKRKIMAPQADQDLDQIKNKNAIEDVLIPSPCISVCALDNDDICAGCYRSVDEITGWNDFDNAQRKDVIIKANQRCKDMWG